MFGTIEQALEDLRAGKFIVVADDEDRENEGDLIGAAEFITPQMVNFLMKAKGMICVALSPERVNALGLAMMGAENTDALRTAYTVTIDAAPHHGVTTGISALRVMCRSVTRFSPRPLARAVVT
jgi:3,4-dihydroxy 2-butanone 4-phosphate synthase/GTP cyclohydrolase II